MEVSEICLSMCDKFSVFSRMVLTCTRADLLFVGLTLVVVMLFASFFFPLLS